jgi:hypothetical protein
MGISYHRPDDSAGMAGRRFKKVEYGQTPLPLAAFVLIGQYHGAKYGPFDFRAMGGGVCIDPGGVIATCAHVIEDFVAAFSPYDLLTLANQTQRKERQLTVQSDEAPYCIFLNPTKADTATTVTFPFMRMIMNKPADAAVVQIGFPPEHGPYGPLPHLAISQTDVSPGDDVRYIAFVPAPPIADRTGGYASEHWGVVDRPASVVAVFDDHFLIDGVSVKGMSGGLVANVMDNTLLGVITEYWRDDFSESVLGIQRSLIRIVKASVLEQLRRQLPQRDTSE